MMKRIMVACLLCAMLSACVWLKPAPVSPADAGASAEPVSDLLYAGTAKVDISPDRAVVSGEGESFRLPDVLPEGEKVPPDNVHDPLYARVLVLKSNDVSLAIVSTDLTFFSSKRVVDEAKKRWGLDHIILSATHTLSGMIPRGLCPTDGGYSWFMEPNDPAETLDWPGLSEDPWYAETEEKIIGAIGQAAENLFPARVASGQSPFENDYMAHNRRFVNPDGSVTMLWSNPDRIATEPLDPTVRVIRVDDEAGKTRALVVHYACHPATLMGAGWVSRDFPGVAVDTIEEKLGDSCMAMFLQGACGDLDPYDTSMRGDEALETVRKAGVSLAEAAVGVAQAIEPSLEGQGGRLQVEENSVQIPYRTGEKSTEACVTTVVIDKNVALATIPGIPFVQHQLNLSAKSPVSNTLLISPAYCGQGSPFILYVPTVQAVKEGGHGADRGCFIAADGGDRLVNAAVSSIERLLAK